MAINIALDARREVEPEGQPIPRSFVGFDPQTSDEMLWDANRGVYTLDERASEQRFATFSHDGQVRLVAELEGIENFDLDGEVVSALMGRILVQGDPVRDALVGRTIDADETVSYLDTVELDTMLPSERYAAPTRERRTFLLTVNPSQWVWTPEDEEAIVSRTAAGASWREPWSAGGRRQGIEPGDRVFLLQNGSGERGIRGSGVVSSHVYQSEHWDDPRRMANYVDVSWDMMLPVERLVPLDQLRQRVPGYGWTPQKGGVELHEPMATELEALWQHHLGDDSPTVVQHTPGWAVDDPRRRVLAAEARRRVTEAFTADGWEVVDTYQDRPYDAVASRNGETAYLLARGIETVSRPVLLDAGEAEHLKAHPDDSVVGILSDVEFAPNGSIEPGSGILTIQRAQVMAGSLSPVLFSWQPETSVETLA